MRTKLVATLASVALLPGCDAAPPPAAAPAPAPAAAEAPRAQAEPELLPTPFSAEQIRDEWILGLTLVMHTRSPEGESRDRWQVVAADDEGAEIELTPIDAEGAATGEAKVERSAWTELRDHASYPATVASREQTTRDTALGQLDGWLYTVRDEATGAETEVFFAESLPGAPVEMRMSKDGAVVLEMTQVERQKPEE